MPNDKVIIDNDICNRCKWFFGGRNCMAFPNGIPDEIMHGENQHSEPLPEQDNEIVFEPMED